MDDGHGAAGTVRTELFAEDALLAWLNGRVVNGSGVQRHFIPHEQTVERVGGDARRGMVGKDDVHLARRHGEQGLKFRAAGGLQSGGGTRDGCYGV